MNNIFLNVTDKINKGEEISPFLFIGKNLETLNSQIEDLAKSLLKEYNIPNAYLYTLRDNWENLKIKDVKDFVEFSNTRPPYKFQIFFIENTSRLTLASSNSLLKFFEEPWKENIIFLSNFSENNILDTILSRVQIVNLWWIGLNKENSFFQSLIKSYINNESDELVSYFFKSKLEKEEYLNFLENILIYAKKNFCFVEYLEELDEDINLIKQNNLNARFITDKWIIKIMIDD